MKIKLISRLWNKEPGTIVEVTEGSPAHEMIMRKKYGVVIEEKAIEKAPKNKAEPMKRMKSKKAVVKSD